MANKSSYPLYDRLLDGRLTQKLTKWRNAGLSYYDISIELRQLDVEVTPATVARWCDAQGITA